MKEITRTIFTSTCYASLVYKLNGQLVEEPLPPLIWIGERLKEEKAFRLLRREHGKKMNILINHIDIKEDRFGLSFEDFMTYAHKIEKREMPQTMEESLSDQKGN